MEKRKFEKLGIETSLFGIWLYAFSQRSKMGTSMT